jgi:hypothetical protein
MIIGILVVVWLPTRRQKTAGDDHAQTPAKHKPKFFFINILICLITKRPKGHLSITEKTYYKNKNALSD